MSAVSMKKRRVIDSAKDPFMTSEETPKLYTNRPKKAQLKKFQEQKGEVFASSIPTPPPPPPPPSSSSSSAASAAAATYTMGSSSGASPPPPPKESFARRYKFLWPLLLTVNLAVGAYIFMRTKKKDTSITEEEGAKDASSTPVLTAAAITAVTTEKPVAEFVKLREPIPVNQQREPIPVDQRRELIPVDQQRELFKWILEEKRKVKPKDPEDKKLIDEEKAILKKFIRAKSIPSI